MDKQDKIEKYLLDRMTGNEKADFEIEMHANPDLKEQVDLDREIMVQLHRRAFVEAQINQAKADMKRGKVVKMVYYSLAVAATFLGIFFVHGLWQDRQYDKLYSSAFTAYPNDYATTDYRAMRGETTVDSLLISAMTAYEQKRYTEAEQQLTQLLNTRGEKPELRFSLALAQLANDKTESAVATLTGLYAQPQGFPYYEQTRWYLALAHLKLHHKSEAKKYLNELVVLDGEYLDLAKGMLEKL